MVAPCFVFYIFIEIVDPPEQLSFSSPATVWKYHWEVCTVYCVLHMGLSWFLEFKNQIIHRKPLKLIRHQLGRERLIFPSFRWSTPNLIDTVGSLWVYVYSHRWKKNFLSVDVAKYAWLWETYSWSHLIYHSVYEIS